MEEFSAKFTVAILFGGPSLERGISLNSARSVMDHLESNSVSIVPLYFDTKKRAYKISKAQLYSNTPSDFDFKLKRTVRALSEKRLLQLLRQCDIVFPIMHGQFGEDGEIQGYLQKNHIPFVGSGKEACKKVFDKFVANELVKQAGFFTLPSVVLKIYHTDHKKIIEKFFKDHKVKRAVVKPAGGGSSIGVFSVSTPAEALEKVRLLFSKRMDTRVVMEPFAQGVEFTVIILENRFGLPVALIPTEIETDYTKHQIFDFRKKYLPSRQVTYHCPPRFSDAVIEKIQAQAEQFFSLFGMHDFGRFDGWVLPDGNIWFCDFNPISGMEQNSFLFQQGARVGMTHSGILSSIVERAATRQDISFPSVVKKALGGGTRVPILMGGDNSERQVSLMSGTNVWLKLRHSKLYQPEPYLLDTKGVVWKVPYHLCLNHTVEEIMENCENYPQTKKRLAQFEDRARIRLGLPAKKDRADFFEPKKETLKKFIDESEFVFIALHGGDGENGNLQRRLKEKNVRHNGSDEKVSRLCMDKGATSSFIHRARIDGVDSICGKAVTLKSLLPLSSSQVKVFWKELKQILVAETIIVKPSADGCSTGIVHLYSSSDLVRYLEFISQNVPSIPKGTFRGQEDIIEMPTTVPDDILFEKFIETDVLRVRNGKLKYRRTTGWIEVTVGVVGSRGKVQAFNPSITVVEGEVLSVEEKFQGGTGVNITPPPREIIRPAILKKVRERISTVAKKVGIEGYARIDAFVNVKNGNLLIIEINTLPALTPSTVFYQQALAEKPPLYPRQLLEELIRNMGYK